MINKETLAVSLKLFVITAIAALCLAAVNKITTPIIAENNKILEKESQQEVLPQAVEFMASETPEIDREGITVDKVNAGLDKDGNISGYVVTVTSNAGYGGDIKIMAGISADLKVQRVKIMESSETAGLGANASKPGFIDQFVGAGDELSVVKGEAKDNEISAIASATVTSKAVTSCVNAALDVASAKSKSGEVEETAKKLEEIKQETEQQISVSQGGVGE
jgi:electron transport complex protein RnfG